MAACFQPHRCRDTSAALLVIRDLRSPLFHLNLRGHFLQARAKRFDLLLQPRNGDLLFCHRCVSRKLLECACVLASLSLGGSAP